MRTLTVLSILLTEKRTDGRDFTPNDLTKLYIRGEQTRTLPRTTVE